METIIIKPVDVKQKKMIKALLKAVDVDFKIQKNNSPYDSDFVQKIRRGKKAKEENMGISINPDDLWK